MAYKATTKNRATREGGEYTLLPLTANENGFIAPVVKNHVEKFRAERRLPAQTPRDFNEILQEVGQHNTT